MIWQSLIRDGHSTCPALVLVPQMKQDFLTMAVLRYYLNFEFQSGSRIIFYASCLCRLPSVRKMYRFQRVCVCVCVCFLFAGVTITTVEGTNSSVTLHCGLFTEYQCQLVVNQVN